jgi:hypothetical protein
MEAAALPPGLQHLAPMSTETVFLLGVIALTGTGNHDFIYASMVEHLIEEYEEGSIIWEGVYYG